MKTEKKLSPHDKAGDIGFYFYRVTNATSFPPAIDVLCADGNWDFSINTSTQTLIRTTPNVNGEDEMSFYRNINGITYACYTPVYNENSAWGDAEDAFDQVFNNVFSPASNPRNTSSLQFSIEVIGTDQITFYFDGDGNGDEFAGSPSKPQNLHLTYSNPYHPSLAWDLNTEPDISSYKIYRSYDNSSFYLAGVVSHPTNTFIDYEISYTKPIWEKSVKYYVVAVDNTNLTSVPSNQVETAGIMQDPLPKLIANNYFNEHSKKYNFSLYKNYPNPFNPTTKNQIYIT
ncbi:hypothetical protein ABRY23_14025 [Melioribacteraceae bacterium 4301-Me]|uniref:hypothetical protein n=1 Tax=Pyranulibacter aquaticus TaxID=3163344 RepID=UPI00359B9EA4